MCDLCEESKQKTDRNKKYVFAKTMSEQHWSDGIKNHHEFKYRFIRNVDVSLCQNCFKKIITLRIWEVISLIISILLLIYVLNNPLINHFPTTWGEDLKKFIDYAIISILIGSTITLLILLFYGEELIWNKVAIKLMKSFGDTDFVCEESVWLKFKKEYK